MQKIYLLLVAICLQLAAFSQTDIPIGTSTTGNTATTYPCPLQDFYEGSRMQFLYLASELTAAGMGPGNISAIKYNVTSVNAFLGTIEQMKVGIGSTTNGSLGTNTWETGITDVYGPVNDTVFVGTKVITFSAPFFWNGSDNIVVEICNGDPTNGGTGVTTYTENVSVPWTTGLSFNGSHTYRADNLGNLCGTANTANTGNQTDRPDIIFSWTAASPSGCYVPSGIMVSNIMPTTADAMWNPPAAGSTPTQYMWELRTSGAAGSGASGLVASGTSTLTTLALSSLTPITTYKLYLKTDCGSGNISLWSGGLTFTTACAPIATLNEKFDGVAIPTLPLCWSSLIRSSGTAVPTVTTNSTAANVYSSPNAVSLFNSSATATDDIILITPQLNNVGAGTYRLTFFARNSNATQDIEVGTLDNNTSTASFTMLEAIDINTTYTKYTVSFANYTGTDQYIGIRRQSTTTFTYVYIDNIVWELIPACQEPTGLMHTNVTSSGAQLDWTAPAAGGTPTGYDIYYSTTRTDPIDTTTATATAATNTYNMTGLLPATKYYIWVRTKCGVGVHSPWSGVDSLLTECVATNAFSENFDGVTTPALPICWSKLLRFAGTPIPSITTTAIAANVYSSPNAVSLYNSSAVATDDIILISPLLNNVGAGTHRLTFYARNSNATQDIEVGTLDNNTSTATFTSLEAVDINTNYAKYTVSFANYSGTDQYIGIRRVNTTTFTYVYVDNIVWEAVPLCQEVTNLTHTNVTSFTAQLDWTAPAAGGTPTGYDIYYSTTRTAPTDTTTATATAATNTYNMTGLLSATKYYVWVRTQCGVGVHSPWSGVDSLLTECIATNAFSENFGGATTPALPICWSKLLRFAGTPTPAITTTTTAVNVYSSPNAVSMFNSSAVATDDIILVSPLLNNVGAGTHRLTFYAKNSNATQDIEVGTLDNNTSTAIFTALETVDINTAYTKYAVSFANYSGTDKYIGIRRLNSATFTYVYLDDIVWELTPSCLEPNALTISNIATTSAQIDWTAPTSGSPASYDVFVSNVNTAPIASTTPTATVVATTYTMSGLTPATQYFAWVRSGCGAAGNSVWARADSFYTQCNATNLPYTQNFETATVPGMPNCTNRQNVGTGNNWITINNPGSGFTSKTLEYPYNGGNAADVWFYTQGLNLTAGSSYRVTFRYGCNSATYTESLNVSYGSTASAASMTDLIVDYPSIKNTTPNLSTTDFTPSASGVYYIGFHAYSIANQFNLFVDDIVVDITPTCVAPNTVIASNIDSTSAYISWQAPAVTTPLYYHIYSNTTRIAPTASTPVTDSVPAPTTTFNMTGLTPSTKYYVWVRSSCGGGDVSYWSGLDSFVTSSPVYTWVSVSGFNADVIADGTGPASNSITADIDNVSYNFVAADYQYDATCPFPTRSLPVSRQIYYPAAGFYFKLAPYNGDNSLRLTSTNVGTLTFATPLPAEEVYLLATSGSGASKISAVVNFSDGSTKAFDSLSISDWYGSATNAVAQGIGRVLNTTTTCGGLETSTVSPKLYRVLLAIDTSNQGKNITSVTVSRLDGITGFGGIPNIMAVGAKYGNRALPVTLSSFKGYATDKGNRLEWITQSESNNTGYEVQRSFNGSEFAKIGFVSTKAINGNSSVPQQYGFIDINTSAGTSYYRLKQIDKDAKYSLTKTIIIKRNGDNAPSILDVYPNPATDRVNIVLNVPVSEKAAIIITDLTGRVVLQQKVQTQIGDNAFYINIQSLASGSYMIKAVCSSGCESAVRKLIKQK